MMSNTNLLNRFVMLFRKHDWKLEEFIYNNRIVFTERVCSKTGIRQRLHRDAKWHDANEPWKWDWEREWRENAVPLHNTMLKCET